MHIKIAIDNIGKIFGKKLLFSEISTEIDSGQCLAITGRNGSGKSTLIKIIAGLIRPSAGQISFILDNKIVLKDRINYIGMVSMDMAMYTALTAIENILFWTKVRGVACSRRQAEELCCQVGLCTAGGDPVSTYSTGMRQRLKLAVIKAVNPPVWLLDEPSSNLDENGRNLVNQMIANAVRQNRVVIIASNEVGEVQYATNKIEL